MIYFYLLEFSCHKFSQTCKVKVKANLANTQIVVSLNPEFPFILSFYKWNNICDNYVGKMYVLMNELLIRKHLTFVL